MVAAYRQKGETMRIYLATSYARREEMMKVAEDIRAIGGEVTSRWITGAHEIEPGNNSRNLEFAIDDWYDLMGADTFILFTEAQQAVTRGGHHVEFGIALALDKRMMLVGPQMNVFHYLDKVSIFPTWEKCLARLRGYFGMKA